MNLRSLLTMVLLLSIIGLAAAFGVLTGWGEAIGKVQNPPRVAPGVAKDASLLPAFKLAFDDASSHKLMVDRPLFTPTRAPAPAAAAPAAAAPTMQRGKYVLTGAIVAADVRAAYLREAAGNKSHSVKQGDTLPDGYRVELVEARKVVLRFNSDTEELELQSGGGPVRLAAGPLPAQGFVAPLSPYTSTIDRPLPAAALPGIPGLPAVPGLPGAPGVQALPGVVYPPGFAPPQAVATSTPGFPVAQGSVPPAPAPAVAGQTPPPVAGSPTRPAEATNPPRRRMWQNAQ